MRARTLFLTLFVLCLLPIGSAQAASSKFTIRGAGFGHGVGMSQYGAYGFAKNGSGYRDILAHYYTGTAIGNLDPAKRVRVLLQSTGTASFSGATRAGRRRLSARKTYYVRRRGASVAAAVVAAQADGHLPGPARHAQRRRGAAARPRRQRPRLGHLPRRARLPRRRVLGRRRRQLAAARQLPPGRRPRRVPAVVADRGAEGPGRRGPHLRDRDDEARRDLRPLPRHALAGLRRRGRRGGLDEPGGERRPAARSSPTTASRS